MCVFEKVCRVWGEETCEARHHSLFAPKQSLQLLLLEIRNGERRPGIISHLMDAWKQKYSRIRVTERRHVVTYETGMRAIKQATTVATAKFTQGPPHTDLVESLK